MNSDTSLTQVLDLVLRLRHEPDTQFIFVSSPPGGGKTGLVEIVAPTAGQLGLRVAVACPRAEQAFALVRRLLAAYPQQRIRLLVGTDRPLPADLHGQVFPLGRGAYDLGPKRGPLLSVGTVAKWAVLVAAGNVVGCDLLILDEADQVTLAEFTPLLGWAPRFLLVGDPGQLPPLVQVDAEPFVAATYRVHEPAARELRRHRPGAPHLRLPLTHRLPPDSIPFLQPLYPDLPFRSSATPAQRRLTLTRPGQRGDGVDCALDLLATGASLVVLELPDRQGGGFQVDHEVAELMAEVAARMVGRRMGPLGVPPFTAQDLGVVDPHVASGEAVRRELEARHPPGGCPVVGTPEVWQGLERPVMIVHHLLSGSDPASAFSLDPGRACVSLSRHQFGCVVVARAGVERTLQTPFPEIGARLLGSPDRRWQGLQFQRHLWRELRRQGRIVRV